MNVTQVKHTDFNRIAKDNEYYLWHFVRRNQQSLSLQSMFGDNKDHPHNGLFHYLNIIDIPYFESYTDESIDFLIRNGVPAQKLWAPKPKFSPVIVGFHRKNIVASTFDFCYCVEGITDIIYKMNPKFLEKID